MIYFSPTDSLAFLHHGCVFWMTAIIWLVQLVLYPAFHFIDVKQFKKFHAMHSARITYLVAAPMLIQLFVSLFLLGENFSSIEWRINAFFAISVFALTFLFSIPAHHVLKNKKDDLAIKRLIRTNWFRTVLWTIQCLYVFRSFS